MSSRSGRANSLRAILRGSEMSDESLTRGSGSSSRGEGHGCGDHGIVRSLLGCCGVGSSPPRRRFCNLGTTAYRVLWCWWHLHSSIGRGGFGGTRLQQSSPRSISCGWVSSRFVIASRAARRDRSQGGSGNCQARFVLSQFPPPPLGPHPLGGVPPGFR